MNPPRYPSPFDSAAFQQLLHVLDEVRRFIEFAGDHAFPERAEAGDWMDPAAAPGIRGKGFLHTLQRIIFAALSNPDSLAEHYAKFAQSALRALNGEAPDSAHRDRRFKDEMWRANPFYRG